MENKSKTQTKTWKRQDKWSFSVLTTAGSTNAICWQLLLGAVSERRSGLQILNQNQTPMSWSLGFNKVVSSKCLQFGTNSVRLKELT